MTAEEFIKGCEHDGSYVPVKEVLRLMVEYARTMCDKQKEICAFNVDLADYYGSATIDTQSILNAPYPDELQRNN